MGYIKRVRDTASQFYNLHDERIDNGIGINVIKDWAVNDTQSTKYITNRTHYTDNRFELIYPEWNGYFSNNKAPETVELNDGTVLYKLTNIPITTTIANSDLEDIIVFYNPASGTPKYTETLAEACERETEIKSTQSIGTNVEEIIYGTIPTEPQEESTTFTIYNVLAQESVEIGNKIVKLTEGIYSIGKPSPLAEDVHPIKKPDHIERLDIKYIPLELIQKIDTIESNYATTTYVDTAIQIISGQIPDISGKMDKNNPEGTGRLKIKGNDGYALFAKDAYVNYNFDLGQGQKVATENYVTTAVSTKMDANKRIFDSLFIGNNQNNNRVLTTADISTISGKAFKGIYANSEYLPVGTGRVEEGDYAYILNQYVTGGSATITKYTYTNGSWTAAQNSLATNTFTPIQWKNINTDLQTELQNLGILSLENRIEELEAKVNVMFEFAEGQEF